MDNELTQLAIKYKTDRHPGAKHSYTSYYYELLKDKKELFKKVLEIGIGPGGGLMMWRDFFPNAKIYGADNKGSLLMRRNRIESISCDQANEEHLQRLIQRTGSDLDLVIDDGSHIPEDQVFTCLNLMPHLKKDVIYIIEDVSDPSIVDQLSKYQCEIPDIPKKNRYDNRLVVVRHKPSEHNYRISCNRTIFVLPHTQITYTACKKNSSQSA